MAGLSAKKWTAAILWKRDKTLDVILAMALLSKTSL
jgi:hypothetical protein